MKVPFFIWIMVFILGSNFQAGAAFGKRQSAPASNMPADSAREEVLSTGVAGIRQLPKLSFRQGLQLLRQVRKPGGPANNVTQTEAAILCITLGALGAHRFVMGYKSEGTAQMLLLLLGLMTLLVGSFQLFGPPRIDPEFLIFAIIIFAALGLWVLYDFYRILRGKLKPKKGSFGQAKSE